MLDPKQKARLIWHCRRGMLELDLILQKFTDTKLDSLSPAQIQAFDLLLTTPDPELYCWFMGQKKAPTEELQQIVDLICATN